MASDHALKKDRVKDRHLPKSRKDNSWKNVSRGRIGTWKKEYATVSCVNGNDQNAHFVKHNFDHANHLYKGTLYYNINKHQNTHSCHYYALN